MRQTQFSRGILLVYTSLAALFSFILLGSTVLSPSEPRNAVVLGFSLPRLALAIGFLAAFLFFGVLSFRAFQDRAWAERVLGQWFGGGHSSLGLAWFAGICLGLGWTGCFLPVYRAGILAPHWNRIQPLMVFLLFLGAATLAVFLLVRSPFRIRDLRISSTFRLSLIYSLVGLLVLGWMLSSKYGVHSMEDLWYGAGVPILTSQLFLAVITGVLFLVIRWNSNAGRKDLLILFVLFAATAFLWAREPLQRSFLFTDPRPPNEIRFPFADSAAFDAGSQFALIGQGIFIFNNPFTDRPLYLSHLVYLHSLFGQDYELLMAAQAAIFAILPALVYLIGRSLDMRAVGFAAAVMTTLRGLNSIAGSNLIDLAGPKMILSDFPAAIGVALIVLLACEWLKKPDQKWHYALWVGGAIGLTLMVRPNGLVILLLLPFLAIPRFAPHWRKWLLASALIGLGAAAVTLPWEARSLARGGTMYSWIVTKVQDVIRTRYVPPAEEGSLSPQGIGLPPLMFQHVQVLSRLSPTPQTLQEPSCNSIVCFAPKHFLHNTITSILILPTSPMFDDLWNTVKGERLYWRADWDGTLTPTSLFFLIVNLFIVALGISVAWSRLRLTGLVPLAVFTIYNLSNALARTSGGRYIVPMDWIVSLYYMAGILFLVTEAARIAGIRLQPFFDQNREDGRDAPAGNSSRKALSIVVLLLTAGSLIPLSEMLHPPRYTGFDAAEILQGQEAQLLGAGLEPAQIREFLGSPGAEILVGRTLYPRSYRRGQGEISFYFYPYTIMDFPRSGFFLIGPEGQNNILLPGREPDYLPHAADALVVGCRDQNYIDALLVAVLDESGAVYTRSPMTELACPMKQPVCINNNECE